MIIAAAVTCIALTVYHESRDQPVDGQIMVAKVVLERSKTEHKSPCNVAFAKKQFSWANGKAHMRNGKVVINAKYVPSERIKKLKHKKSVLIKAGKKKQAAKIKPVNKAWDRAMNVARAAYKTNTGPCEGATFYHTLAVHPNWDYSKLKPVCVVADHIFYKKI